MGFYVYLLTNFGLDDGGKHTALSESFTHSAEQSQNAALHASQSAQHSLSSAISKLEHFDQNRGHQVNYGDGYTNQEQAIRDHALSDMHSIATDVANRNHVSFDEALRALTEASANWGVHGSGSIKFGELGPIGNVGMSISGGVGGRGSTDSTTGHAFQKSSDLSISAQEQSQFRDGYSVVDSYIKTHHLDINDTQTASVGDQISAELRRAEVQSQQYAIDQSKAERFSQMASYCNVSR